MYMPHYAKISTDDNKVLQVIRSDTKEWCEQNLGGTWVRTYYNTQGKNYAGIGYTYHSDVDNFSEPRPYPSWTLDENLHWQPPIPQPTDVLCVWDEKTLSWTNI